MTNIELRVYTTLSPEVQGSKIEMVTQGESCMFFGEVWGIRNKVFKPACASLLRMH